MADARHHDFARIHVDWGCHVELAHWRSTHSRADVQAVFAVPDFGLQQLPDRGGRTYMMPGRLSWRWPPVVQSRGSEHARIEESRQVAGPAAAISARRLTIRRFTLSKADSETAKTPR